MGSLVLLIRETLGNDHSFDLCLREDWLVVAPRHVDVALIIDDFQVVGPLACETRSGDFTVHGLCRTALSCNRTRASLA